MLSLENVHAFYGASHVLQGVTLTVNAGEIVCLLGRNGVGKTTTLKTIMGFLSAAQGRVAFEGRELAELRPFEVARRGICFVPEDRRVLPRLTVLENLELGLSTHGRIRARLRQTQLDRVFEYFPALRARKRQLGGTLSGGEQQMLAIGRALMSNARLMLLDEPTEGLAPLAVGLLVEIVRKINHDGLTILVVEQNARVALDLADRAYIMEKGRVVFAGTPDEIRRSDDALRRLGV